MPHRNFDPFPVLMAERVVLRKLSPEDAQRVFEIRSDESVNQFIDRPLAVSIKQALEFIDKIEKGIAAGQSMYWAIQLKNEPGLIGTICMWNIEEEKQSAEIGYELHPRFQGKGYMQEALEKVIRFGFDEIQLNMITAFCHCNNKKSLRLLTKNQFSRNLLLEQEMVPGPEPCVIYSLSNPNDKPF